MKPILILENIRSAENTGSLFRTADALGVGELVLVGTTPSPIDRFGRARRDIHKTALGAESMEWTHVGTIEEAIAQMKKRGYALYVLEQDERSIGYLELKTSEPWALVVGNEVEGVSEEVRIEADAIIEIPMSGKKESLNVAVATGIALSRLVST